MLLNYGAFDPVAIGSPGLLDRPEYTLTKSEMQEFWRNYLPSPDDRTNPLANLAVAELTGLPPTCLVIAEQDILCAENLALAQRLRDAGVAVEATVYPGTTHSFLEAVSIASVSDAALAQSSAWLAQRL